VEEQVVYSNNNPFCIDKKPILQFQEEALAWETDTEGWIYEWRQGAKYGDFKAELLKDSEIRKEYNALKVKYGMIKLFILVRNWFMKKPHL